MYVSQTRPARLARLAARGSASDAGIPIRIAEADEPGSTRAACGAGDPRHQKRVLVALSLHGRAGAATLPPPGFPPDSGPISARALVLHVTAVLGNCAQM